MEFPDDAIDTHLGDGTTFYGEATAAIPLLRGGQATTIRLPQDEAPGDLKRELYVQQG